MKIKIEDREYIVSWNYSNPVLEKQILKAGMTREEFIELVERKVPDPIRPGHVRRAGLDFAVREVEKVVMKKIDPLPSVCTCIVKSENEVVAIGQVKRFVKDPFNKEVARKKAFGTAILKLFPKYTEKSVRKEFWKGYLERS